MDKLTIINRALSATGNNTLLNINDGSDEAIAVEIAFDRAVDYMMAFHEWPFNVTTIVPTSLGTAELPPYKYALQMPTDCWHLRSVVDDTYGIPQQHRVVNNKIQVLDNTGLKLLYLTRPSNSSAWHPAAAEVLTLMCEAELAQGLNEDDTAATASRTRTENMLAKAAGRVGQQDSGKRVFFSATGLARRTRKGGGWGI